MSEEEARAAAIPVFEEELRVRQNSKGNRLSFSQDLGAGADRIRRSRASLRRSDHEATIERVLIDRVIDAVPGIRQEGDTIIVPVIEEIMVVEKRLLLKEEMHIYCQEVVQHVRQPVRLRSEEVSLERQPVRHPDNVTAKEDRVTP